MPRAATTSDAFNAIAEPCRRDILKVLADGELPVGELVVRLDLPQPQVSKHLTVLRTVDLVRSRAQGRQRLYRINGPALRPVFEWVGTFEHLWNQRLDRLLEARRARRAPTREETIMSDRHGSATVTLPTECEILITRIFDTPVDVVFEAWTTPDLVKRWWASDDAPLSVCDIDLRVGGSWRYVQQGPSGTELGWHGTYREIAAPERLVSTEVFEGFPDAESVNTLTLSEDDGTTTLSVLVRHATRENRDGHIDSGMEPGMQIVLDRLEDLLSSSAAHR